MNAIVLADLHWGAVSPDQFAEELQYGLFTELHNMELRGDTLDYIFIAGDLTHSKQYLSSDTTQAVIRFMHELAQYATRLSSHIYVIQGTRTHDADQLDTLELIMSTSNFDNVTFIKEVTALTLTNNKEKLDVLFIPEEYVADQDAYYSKYFENHYDFIFGHGMIDKIWYAQQAKEEHGATAILSAPVFPVDDLTEYAEYVFFGHVHTYKRYGKKKRFWYVGPYTRWEFGKEGPCGYIYLEYDTETKLMAMVHKDNINAPILPTRIINIQDAIEIREINDMIDAMIAEELSKKADRIRFIINLNTSLENSNTIKDFIVSKMAELNFVKLLLSADLNAEAVDNMKEIMEEKRMQQEYLFDVNLPIANRIQRFIKTRNGKDITVETIQKYLTEEDDNE